MKKSLRTRIKKSLSEPRSAAIWAALVTTCFCAVCGFLINLWVESLVLREERKQADAEISAIATRLDLFLDLQLNKLDALDDFILRYGDDPGFDARFQDFSTGLVVDDRVIFRIVVSPGGVNEYVYPASDTNLLRGENYLQDTNPLIVAAAQHTIETGKITVSESFAQPEHPLVIVMIKPVYRANQYWGTVSIWIELQTILDQIGINQPDSPYLMAIYSSTGKVVGDYPDLNQYKPVTRPVEQGVWLLSAIPRSGWKSSAQRELFLLRLATVLICLLAAAIFYLLTKRNKRLELSVHERTVAISRNNRALRVLVESGQALVRAEQENELMQKICTLLVEQGGYMHAWVGNVLDAEKCVVQRVTWAGDYSEMDHLCYVTGKPCSHTDCPVAQAIRRGVPSVSLLTEEFHHSGMKALVEKGFGAAASFPLVMDNRVQGILSVYSSSVNFFTVEEVGLLSEMCSDLSFGIATLRARERHRQDEISLRRYELFIKHSTEMVMFVDLTRMRILDVNQAFLETYGYSMEELYTMEIENLRPPSLRGTFRVDFEAGMQTGKSYETTHIHRDGTTFPVLVSVQCREVHGERIALSLIRDITEAKEAQEALWENEQKFRQVLMQSSDGILLGDEDGMVIEYSRGMEEMTGYSREETIGKPLSEVLWRLRLPSERTPQEYADFRRLIARSQHSGEGNWLNQPQEHAVIQKSGGTRIFSSVSFSIRTRKGWILGSVSRDVTERRLAEDELRHSQMIYRTLVENIPNAAVALFDRNLVFTTIQGQELDVWGQKSEELSGNKLIDLFSPDIAESTTQRYQRVIEDGVTEIFQINFKGEIYEVTVVPVWDEKHQQITGGLAMIHRATERIMAIETLRISEERYRSIFESSTEAHLLLSDVFLDCNQTASLLFGFSREEIIGRSPLDFSPEFQPDGRRSDEVIQEKMAAVRAYGPQKFDWVLFHKDGSLRYSEMSVSMLHLGEMWLIQASIRDVTERILAERKNQAQLERLSALREIDKAINASLNLRLVLSILVEEARKQLHADAVGILLRSQLSSQMVFSAGSGFRTSHPVNTGYLQTTDYVLQNQILEYHQLMEKEDLARHQFFVNEGFETYFGMHLSAKGRTKGILEVFMRSEYLADEEWLDFLETLAGQAAIAIDNAELFESTQHSNMELLQAYEATIEGWSRALDLRDQETEGHTLRVKDYSIELGRRMGLDQENLNHIRRGALLHDIGKMGIPDHILLKPGPLTEEEWEIMRQHPVYAYQLLTPIRFLGPAVEIPYCHHEKWDGTGYPRGLKGEMIPFSARIFAIVDVWDALKSDRPYRRGWSNERVCEYLRAQSGTHFDPQVVHAFLGLLGEETEH